MVIEPLPVLVSATIFCPLACPTGTLPQTSEEGDAVAVPPDEVVPVPESETVSGVVLALSVML